MYTQISIRIDDQLKNAVQKKAKELWVSLSALTKLFFKSLVSDEKILKIDCEKVFEQALKDKKIKQKFVQLWSLI